MTRGIGKIGFWASTVVLSLAVQSAGCEGEAPPTGTLEVPFQFGIGTAKCGDVGVVKVTGTLDDGLYEADVTCAADEETGTILFSDVEEGNYPMQLMGLDDEGIPVVDTPVLPVEVKFEGDKNSMEYESTVSLSTAPARLEIRWNLGFGSCQSTGIESLRIEVYRSERGTDEPLFVADLACSLAPDSDEDYRRVPDPDRDADGELLQMIRVQPLDENDVEIGDAVIFALDPPGAGRTVQLSLDCTAAGCEGTGEPD
jgi:hypothetical protein